MSSDFATADTLVIASDIGKNVHWLGCYDGRLNVLVEPHKLTVVAMGSIPHIYRRAVFPQPGDPRCVAHIREVKKSGAQRTPNRVGQGPQNGGP